MRPKQGLSLITTQLSTFECRASSWALRGGCGMAAGGCVSAVSRRPQAGVLEVLALEVGGGEVGAAALEEVDLLTEEVLSRDPVSEARASAPQRHRQGIS